MLIKSKSDTLAPLTALVNKAREELPMYDIVVYLFDCILYLVLKRRRLFVHALYVRVGGAEAHTRMTSMLKVFCFLRVKQKQQQTIALALDPQACLKNPCSYPALKSEDIFYSKDHPLVADKVRQMRAMKPLCHGPQPPPCCACLAHCLGFKWISKSLAFLELSWFTTRAHGRDICLKSKVELSTWILLGHCQTCHLAHHSL